MRLNRQPDGSYRSIDERYHITRGSGGWAVRKYRCRTSVTVPSLKKARDIAAAPWIQKAMQSQGLTAIIREHFADDPGIHYLLLSSLGGDRRAFRELLRRLDGQTRIHLYVDDIGYAAMRAGILPKPKDRLKPFVS